MENDRFKTNLGCATAGPGQTDCSSLVRPDDHLPDALPAEIMTPVSSRISWCRLRGLTAGNYADSVVRRAAILLGLLLPAFAANYLLLYFAARLMTANNFGMLYVSSTLGNILFSGAVILNVFFTRHLVRIHAQSGRGEMLLMVRRIEHSLLIWCGGACAVVFVAMLAIGWHVGVESWVLILMIALNAYANYIADIGCITLQSLGSAVGLGLYTLIWMMIRLGLCIGGIYLFGGTVWGAMAGITASAVIMYLGFHTWIHGSFFAATEKKLPPLPALLAMLPFILSYGAFIALSYLDVLVAYLVIDDATLGAYSASSALPKAILVLTMPVLQMLFPMLVAAGERVSAQTGTMLIRKAGMVMLGLACAGSATVWLLSDWLCGGAWGIKFCRAYPMGLMLLSVVPLSLLRLMVLLAFARGRDWLPMVLALPAVLFVWLIWRWGSDLETLPIYFDVFSTIVVGYFSAAWVLRNALHKRMGT